MCQIRCMAGSAPDSAGPNVKLPAVRHGISGRYASCLWRAAYKANVLTQVELDLAKVHNSPCAHHTKRLPRKRDAHSCFYFVDQGHYIAIYYVWCVHFYERDD